jgi:Flp pilus assembly protein TadG
VPQGNKAGRYEAAGLRRLKREDGSTLVEFAFVFMILITMILGIMEFSRALYAYHFVSSAARQATRWAAVNGHDCGDDSSCNGTGGMNNGPASDADIKNYVTSHATAGIDAGQITVNPDDEPFWLVNADSPTFCSVASTQNSPGCTVQVQVSYNFNFLVPFIRSSAITLSSTSQMTISH